MTTEELRRYNRHLIMPEIGENGQNELLATKVLVIGAGGLGCPVLQYLTAAGVGTVNQLLAMNVTAAQFVNLMLTALQNTQVANANLSLALGALQASLTVETTCIVAVLGLVAWLGTLASPTAMT